MSLTKGSKTSSRQGCSLCLGSPAKPDQAHDLSFWWMGRISNVKILLRWYWCEVQHLFFLDTFLMIRGKE
uniref:Uncharacterized protein n=1 Tax=Rhizophora mucronata TaxID=61149 RepID=A0A2P2NYH9_RHIMU